MSNIITALFNKKETCVCTASIYQYNYGQVIRIQGLDLPSVVEVHFSLTEKGGQSVTRIGVTRGEYTDVTVPDVLLENDDRASDYDLYAFVYLTDKTSGQTERKITIHVKARPKPEVFEKPEEAQLFADAIEAVREARTGSEAAAELAEAWAHGHENHPENAEDNAKYYSGLADASREATEKLKGEVENMKSSVDQSESSVAENLKAAEAAKKAAQESATNASTSEKNAKASETASATSAKNASTSEANAKKSADSAAASKAAVDQTVQEFNQTASDALNAISEAKTESVGAVESAGATQTSNVNKAGTTQTDAVNAAGKKQVGDVNTAGTTKVGEVNSAGAAAVKSIEDTGKTQTANVTKAGTDAVTNINTNGKAQITAIQEEGENQKKAIEDYANEAMSFREQVLANTAALGGFSFVCNPDDGGLDIVYTVSE